MEESTTSNLAKVLKNIDTAQEMEQYMELPEVMNSCQTFPECRINSYLHEAVAQIVFIAETHAYVLQMFTGKLVNHGRLNNMIHTVEQFSEDI